MTRTAFNYLKWNIFYYYYYLFIIYLFSVNIKPLRHRFGLSLCLGLAISLIFYWKVLLTPNSLLELILTGATGSKAESWTGGQLDRQGQAWLAWLNLSRALLKRGR